MPEMSFYFNVKPENADAAKKYLQTADTTEIKIHATWLGIGILGKSNNLIDDKYLFELGPQLDVNVSQTNQHALRQARL